MERETDWWTDTIGLAKFKHMLFGLQPPRQSAKFKPKASIMRDNSFQYNIDIGNISLIFSNNTSIAFALVRSLRICAVFFVLCLRSADTLVKWFFWLDGFFISVVSQLNVLQSLEMSEVVSCQQVLLLLFSLLLSLSALWIEVGSVMLMHSTSD